MMTRLDRGFSFSVLALVALVWSGCGEKGGSGGPAKDTENLTSIRKAYVAATKRLGHPPYNLQELKPSLADEGDADQLLISPNDGLPYVIVFGADYRKHVIAYEQKGADGLRMVVDQTQLPRRLTHAEFESLSFPAGYKKPAVAK
jgi:hypothetical protein